MPASQRILVGLSKPFASREISAARQPFYLSLRSTPLSGCAGRHLSCSRCRRLGTTRASLLLLSYRGISDQSTNQHFCRVSAALPLSYSHLRPRSVLRSQSDQQDSNLHTRINEVTLIFATGNASFWRCLRLRSSLFQTEASRSARRKLPRAFIFHQSGNHRQGRASNISVASLQSAGEQSTFPGLLVRLRHAARRVHGLAAVDSKNEQFIRQSSHSALHLRLEEVSPVIHHRLNGLIFLSLRSKPLTILAVTRASLLLMQAARRHTALAARWNSSKLPGE